jgi:hypothetical protein
LVGHRGKELGFAEIQAKGKTHGLVLWCGGGHLQHHVLRAGQWFGVVDHEASERSENTGTAT